MDLLQETNFIMQKYHIFPNKKYGQNFLINENIIDEIIEKSDISNEDLVFEIGPGLGNLTKKLLEKAGKVIAIEIDRNLLPLLKERFSLYKNFSLINEDVLKIDFNNIIDQNKNFKNFKVVANLPYYITTPITMKLLEEKTSLDSITIMVQKEVAERLTALDTKKKNVDIGAISYAVSYYCNSEIIIDVLKENFYPGPQVDSSVIQLDILKNPKVSVLDEKIFFNIIKSSFMQKRKTLLNSLSNANIGSKEFLNEMLLNLNFKPNIRPEELTLQDFANISNYICRPS